VSVLTGQSIKQRIASDPTFAIEPFIEDALQPASYDFHLADKYLVLPEMNDSNGFLLLSDVFDQFKPIVEERDRRWLKPGELVLGLSVEKFKLSHDVCAMVKQKSSLGRLGVQVCGDAGWIDPGFEGHLVLELRNFNPATIRLYSGQPIGQIVYMYTDAHPNQAENGPATVYDGHYVNQMDFAIRKWKQALMKVYMTANKVHNEFVNK
jgi:dCTP deaminase